MDKKYSIVALLICVVIVAILAFMYYNNFNINSAGQSHQPNVSNSISANQSANTTGKHFFAGASDTVTIKTNP